MTGNSISRGILGWGSYLPYRRLDRSTITAVAGSGGGKGTRTVASFDEDTTTLGVESARQVLRALLSTVPIDAVNTMGIPADDSYAQQGEPPVWNDYRAAIAESGSTLKLEPILKWDFYKAVESPDHVLTIQTADQSLWANVLLTMGCRT